jgi:hypothetical protein
MKQGEAPDFTEDEQGTVWFKNRLCVPEAGDLRETILREAHNSAYSIHLGSTKVYQDLKQDPWHMWLCVTLATGLRLNIRDPLVCFNH